MKITGKLTALTALIILLLASCAKEIDFSLLPKEKEKGCRLITMKADLGFLGAYDIAFAYDADGRIIKSINGAYTNTFSYSPTQIAIKDSDGYTSTITLVNGRATTSTIQDFFNGQDLRKVYSYNADGYLIMVKNYLDGVLNSTDELSYAGGNLVQAKINYELDHSVEIIKYQYSTVVAKFVYDMFDPLSGHVHYMPGGYFGKQSKNILSSATSLETDKDGIKSFDGVIELKYQFNAEGNASSLTMTELANSYFSDGVTIFFSDVYESKYSLGYSCQ